jgi:leucyl aminopeptidase
MEITVKNKSLFRGGDYGIIVFGTQDKTFLYETKDQIIKDTVNRASKKKLFSGKKNQVCVFDTASSETAQVVALCGIGTIGNNDAARNNVADAIRSLLKHGCSKVAVMIPETKDAGAFAQAVCEGILLGSYTFNKYKTVDNDDKAIKSVVLYSDKKYLADVENAANKAETITESVCLARDIVNEPGNNLVPEDVASFARKLAKDSKKLKATVYDVPAMEKMGMGGILAVGKGSVNEPRLITLAYKGRQSDKVDLALVGKGVTFDTGGISLKPDKGMEEMKGDMAGAASVLAAVHAIARLGLNINVTAVVGAVENMPGGKAYKPGDIIKTFNGKTIEVISADAEGRVTLADTVSYAFREIKADRVIDVATLTGACVVALGHVCSGSYTNNQAFMDLYKKAATDVDEKTWQMPMYEEYRDLNKSRIADVMNIGGGRDAGSITAAYFIYEFIEKRPWIHLDIAGVEMVNKTKGIYVYGGTGVPVRTFVKLSELISKTL